MPLSDVVGNAGTVPPLQIVKLVPNANAGVTLGFTVTESVAVVAHCPAVGVNVYVLLVVLLTLAGLHVPVMPLLDVVGKAGAVAPEQILTLVPNVNVGVIFGLTVTVNVCVVAHCPAVGVNV